MAKDQPNVGARSVDAPTHIGTRNVAPAAPAASNVAEDYQNGRLTRHGMEKRINAGVAVIYQGRTITSVSELPGEDELATTESEVQSALDTVDAQIAALQARKAKLSSAAQAAGVKADAKGDEKK